MKTAITLNAGTYTDNVIETRGTTNRHRPFVEHEKGGWIMLQWERKDGEFEVRKIHVSRARAVQAITAMENGRAIV